MGGGGADILHKVISNAGSQCGKIYYESKRTKAFNQEWIKKLKDDNLQICADALVLITETLPNGNIFSLWTAFMSFRLRSLRRLRCLYGTFF